MFRTALLTLAMSFASGTLLAQASLERSHLPTPSAATAPTVVPALVPYSSIAEGVDGKPLTGDVSVTFLLFKDEAGGEPLWTETQVLPVDTTGHYTAQLGASSPSGLPLDVFGTGTARWLEVQIAGQKPQPRTLLTTVPYAAKAADSATLGGLPASAFALAGTTSNTTALNSSAVSPDAGSTVTTTGGTSAYLPKFTGSATIANSQIYDNGTSVGIGDVPNPSAKLDINGGVIMRGGMTVSRTGNATASKGYPSFPFGFYSNAYNSSTKAADNPHFLLQSEPVGNDTANTGATFNLLYSNHGTAPVETGLSVNSAGIMQFAPGQTFPGTGSITGVTAGTALTGGGTTGAVTLNLDTTKVPELSTNNTFSGTEQFKAAVGIGTTPMSNGYTPLTIGTSNSFGTWLALANASSGGHTWNLISAGSGNAEGAGNLGITDLTGKSTIYLEGNTNTTNLTASAGLNAATLVVTSTAGASIIDADGFGANAGGPTPGLRFGGGGSGEGIASNRTLGATKDGLDFYTNFTRRMSVLQNGQVSVGTVTPGAQFGVVDSSNAFPAIYAQGGDAPSSGQGGSDGIDAYGGSRATDGTGSAGSGGVFTGGGFYGYGIYATGGSGDNTSFAGYFNGSVYVNGSLINPSAVTQIDHPLDPANKYLTQASVESSEMKTMYDGTVTSDASGEAVVELPDWFEALNRDFRYQLTVIGQFAQAIVSSEIANHQFTIKTDKPNVKVSWQVTGVRQDAYAKAHPVSVEAPKLGREAGHYLHPELYGAPEATSIEWARHPELMKKLKAHRDQLNTQSADGEPRTPSPVTPAARSIAASSSSQKATDPEAISQFCFGAVHRGRNQRHLTAPGSFAGPFCNNVTNPGSNHGIRNNTAQNESTHQHNFSRPLSACPVVFSAGDGHHLAGFFAHIFRCHPHRAATTPRPRRVDGRWIALLGHPSRCCNQRGHLQLHRRLGAGACTFSCRQSSCAGFS